MSEPQEKQYERTSVTNEENSAFSYHLVLFSDADEMYNLWLPKEPEGFYRFSDKPEHRFLSISARDNRWIASCRKPAYFVDVPLADSMETALTDAALVQISYDDRTYKMLVEKVDRQRSIFHNYNLRSDVEIGIGNHAGCDIYYQGPFISWKHAVLVRRNRQWSIRSHDEIYGIYVNGEKQSYCHLQLGDVIYIMGLKIIVGHTSLAINSGLGSVTVNPRVLQESATTPGGHAHYYDSEPSENDDQVFNRAPRKRRETEAKVITVEGPPVSMLQKRAPLLLRMGSSMVMGGAAALAGNFVSLLTSVMFPFLNSKFSESEQREYEQLRLTKYTEYLQKKKAEIQEAIAQEREILNQKYPVVSNLADKQSLLKHLWERRPCDSDFLELRLGTGRRPLSATIDYPPRRFELEQDDLEDQMYKLVETPYFVDGAPIVLSLIDTFVCGIQEGSEQAINYIRQLVLQIAMFHSYDEVKMVFLLNPDDLHQLDDIRYLPHVWDDQRSMRFIATNEAEAYTIGEYIQDRLPKEGTEKKDLQQILKDRPYFIVFALDKRLLDGHEVLKRIMQSEYNTGVSIITAHSALPKESQKIISLKTPQENVCTTMGIDGGADEVYSLDRMDEEWIHLAMRTLANISLRQISASQSMPKMLTFLEMFKAGRIEQLNPLKRWRENNPTKTLAAPVGVGEDGTLFMLDLHEKRQGPHGLVAGMTGSGKSEFIITYILSMAVNYHPDEVAFLLIDYKGGGLADAFSNPRTGVHLPHLVGTITNLDGASIQRSLMSIESELVRRQKVFSDISKSFNEGSMNIYTYQKLYRNGKVSQPMPHLFIIADEFAELKQQQPEFMDKLISAARIGRSLGVHLILATQKPSGVVNDQIRSNTKFRVCLRVQERSDSMDMLKRPEAAELTDTGRFYLQVGYNEYFAMGQSAWCGADYEPQDAIPVQRDDAVEFLDITGHVTAKAKPKVKKISSGMKQIAAVVEYLSNLAKSQHIQPHNLWVEPLATQLELDAVPDVSEYDDPNFVSAVLGIIDDPEKQRQVPFLVPLQEYHHLLVVGNGGSGKTTLLKTLLYSLTERYTPDRVNYYIMDFSGGTMSVFKTAPHCGVFLTGQDDAAIDRFLKMLREMIEERKNLFNQLGVTSYEACISVKRIPLVFVVIDNASGLAALPAGNTYFSTLHEYIKDASGMGIKFLISCNNMNEVSTRSRQEIGDRIALQLKDKYAYADVLGGRSENVPLAVNGRGMCVCEGRKLEFHTAVPFVQCDEINRMQKIAQRMQQIAERDRDIAPARRLPMIDPDEQYEVFCSNFKKGRIPLGYDTKNIKPISIPLAQLYLAAMYFGKEQAAGELLNNMAYAAQQNDMDLIFVRSSNSVLEKDAKLPAGYPGLRVFTNTKKDSLDLCYLLIEEVKKRKIFRNEYCTEHGIPLAQAKDPQIIKQASSHIRSKTKPLMVIFEDLCEFGANLEDGCFAIYQDIFTNGKGYNFYFIGCFYPHNSDVAAKDLLTKHFAQNALLLLFGGQFQKQVLSTFPVDMKRIVMEEFRYNEFLMRYNGNFYPLVMPCREPAKEITDPDEMPII